MKALFVGRFQPLHKGHEETIRKLLKEYEKVIVLIGSKQKKRTQSNPFSYEERKEMLEIVFSKEINDGKIVISGIEDLESDEEWANKIIENYDFDVVVTGSDWVAKCFEGKKEIKRVELIQPEKINGTNIRRLMKEGNKEWKEYVSEEVARYIQKIGLKEFLSSLPE